MKYFLSFFTSNWGLKILALILAIAVYYSMRDSIRAERGPRASHSSQTFMKGAAQ